MKCSTAPFKISFRLGILQFSLNLFNEGGRVRHRHSKKYIKRKLSIKSFEFKRNSFAPRFCIPGCATFKGWPMKRRVLSAIQKCGPNKNSPPPPLRLGILHVQNGEISCAAL